MRCDTWREAVSAQLDGEDLPIGVDETSLDSHLDRCAACRTWSAAVTGQHRELRVRRAEPVPDLTGSILAALPRSTRPQPIGEWIRYALFTVAATQLLLALPAVLLGEDAGASIHVARELGSFDVALGIGLLWAAWRPARSAGLLPMALALAATLAVTAGIDVARGTAPAVGEAHHVLDLAGVTLLWLLNRPGRQTRPTVVVPTPA